MQRKTLSKFGNILYNVEEVKYWKKGYEVVDKIMNARSTILSINYTDTLIKLDYDNAGDIVQEIYDCEKYFIPRICDKIKLLKTGDVVILPDQLVFIVINKDEKNIYRHILVLSIVGHMVLLILHTNFLLSSIFLLITGRI